MDILILGAGTAGTAAAAVLRRTMPRSTRITLVDPEESHVYQPGLLLLPFGVYTPEQLTKPRKKTLPRGVTLVSATVDVVDPDNHTVTLSNGERLRYDQLVIATGATPRPERTPGFDTGSGVHHFYTLEAAEKLRDAFAEFRSGKLLVGITGLPVKCAVAPLEFAMLAERHLHALGVRDDVEITFFTPLRGAFPRDTCSLALAYVLLERGIPLEGTFEIEDIHPGAVIARDGRKLEFDLLVAAPQHMGADFIERSRMGNELNFIPTDQYTCQAIGYDDVWVLGDTAESQAPKAGSVITYQLSTFAKNIKAVSRGKAPKAKYDGHVNCFIESGDGKALVIDFNYDIDPAYGHFLFPWIGPPLLQESRRSHMGKMAFRHIYWNGLLKGLTAMLPSKYSGFGKHR